MTKILGALSFAALIGAMISGVVLAGLSADVGTRVAIAAPVGHLTLGLTLVFILTYPAATLIERLRTRRHTRVFLRASTKREDRLSEREKKCFYPMLFKTAVDQRGLHAGLLELGEERAWAATRSFRRIGLPRLANMVEDFLEALEQGDFGETDPINDPHFRATCAALETRLNSAGLANLPDILDEALR